MRQALLVSLPWCVALASGGCLADDSSTEPPVFAGRAGASGAAARGGVSSGGTSGVGGRSSAGGPARGGTVALAGEGGAGDDASNRAGRGPSGRGGMSARGGSSGRGGNGAHGGSTAEGGATGVAGPGGAGALGAEGGAGGEGTAGDGASGADGGAGAGGEPGGNRVELAYVSTFLGGLRAFSLSPDHGAPRELSGSPVHEGAHFYDADVDAVNRRLYALDLDAQRIDLYRLANDGTLSAEPSVSKSVSFSPLMLALDPLSRFAYIAGSSDTAVHVFTIDPDTGELDALVELRVDGAPAYVTPDPLGRFLYVTDAIEPGIHAYSVSASGTFTELERSPFAATLVRSGAMVLRPDGQFLYSTGNGLNAFSVDAASGALEAVDGSPFTLDVGSEFFASNLATDSAGRFLYATSAFLTEHLRGFAIDPESGALDEVPGSPITVPGSPYSVAVSRAGGRVYTGNDSGTVSVFEVEADGHLTELDDSPFDAGGLQPEISFAGLP
jgi:6-phosphogluconolactonase (cycloisomerase 2 family)